MGFSFCYRCLSVITEENWDSVAVSGNFFYFFGQGLGHYIGDYPDIKYNNKILNS